MSTIDWEQEQALEQRRVDRILGIIRGRIRRISSAVSEIRANVVDIRKNFWEDVTVNLENLDDRTETRISLKQQAEVLNEQERSHQLALREWQTLNRLEQSPYFGRIDFQEEGFPVEQVYIGVASLLDDEGERFHIYDWRAPISSLYYDYPPGPASYPTPGGEIRGQLELKRQFVIRGGQIRSMFDTGLTIGDELLQQVLGQQSDAQMKSIVATIQRDQNRIIRHDTKRLLIVQGAAGSGKTSAALQRVAYLLYKYRNKIQADQIVLFSPNAMFNSYISNVLPELGEENMQQATIQEYLDFRLGRRFELEDQYEQMEYVLAGGGDPMHAIRLAGIRYKSSASFLRAIQTYAQQLENGGMQFRDLKFRGEVLIPRTSIAKAFYDGDAEIRLSRRAEQAVKWLKGELKRLENEQMDAEWVDEEIQLLEPEEYQKVFKRLRREAGKHGTVSYKQERGELAKLVVRRAFKKLNARISRLRFIDIPGIYRQLFEKPELFAQWADPREVPEEWPQICRMTLEALKNKRLNYEDATPYLYLEELIEGFHTNARVKYVLIDEAQDYSPFQFEFLRRLFPGARITALGDFNQAIFAHARDQDSFEALKRLMPPEESETLLLSKSYRSTRPIIEFTRRIAAGGEAIEAFNREGPLPQVHVLQAREQLYPRIAGEIARLSREGHESVAVICKTAAESEAAFTALRDLAASEGEERDADEVRQALGDLQLVTKDTRTFPQGPVVIPAYLAKGVEFDAVLLHDASAGCYSYASERRLFYTACTRAMHELLLFVPGGALSPFVPAASAGTYELHGDAELKQ